MLNIILHLTYTHYTYALYYIYKGILAAANRRSERLQDISVQQKKRNHKKSQQMSDVSLYIVLVYTYIRLNL